jgi:RNA polymerase sigma-70 factor (ECF subfamily)
VSAPDPKNDCADEELLLRFRRGDEAAFEALVRRYERELYGYLRRYLGDDSLAEDVFQNTFLKVYLVRGRYEPGRPVRPWLYTIATRQAIDALRRQGRHQGARLEGRESADDLGTLLDGLPSPAPGPLDHASAAERRELVRGAVEGLPDFLRQVLVLAYYQGLKYQEIADVLSIPVGTVKSRLHAALVRLHEAWADTPALHDA